ncbi:hypothetical protein L0P88_07125 [Muricauda sp. SCSIO 64092]|uniref:hypothetical protein n=1 Tax=Allomuricauda sp. SCSIO 64092 TaxID=2908842 RepID=UPI001FF1DE65|nr:hypothetical protein [Muricauda sp. SCSIO 64092]UOY08319.1 hypothetical protein L0P88_07125 [Muricauda sp. SCSIO 64092]
MKTNTNTIRTLEGWLFAILTLITFISCEEEKFFDDLDNVLPSYVDGIQNLDEEGIDCGGGSGVACPSCSDGIQNQGEEGIDCGGPCEACIPTPRADELQNTTSPYFFTFEANDAASGRNLLPLPQDAQGVTFNLGAADPAGGDGLVGQILRPENGPFGGFEDFKFQPQPGPIDFSSFNKFTMEVYIPSSNDFSGNLEPLVEVILHDNIDGNFFQRWTILPLTVEESDFDSWVTLRFDGTNAVSANDGTLLSDNATYDNITLRFGGSGHTEAGEFFVRDLQTVTSFIAEGTPRADALSGSGLPFFYTFETGDADSGLHLLPRPTEQQGVVPTYRVSDPAGSTDAVTRILRPENGPFGGFEDFKFQPQPETIDFSVYHKFRLDVYIPSTNDFSGNLEPLVELILHDNVDGNFFQRWTIIAVTIDPSDFDSWVTVEFDGTTALSAADGTTLLPDNDTYDNYTLRLGGFGHVEQGEFYIRDFVPIMD